VKLAGRGTRHGAILLSEARPCDLASTMQVALRPAGSIRLRRGSASLADAPVGVATLPARWPVQDPAAPAERLTTDADGRLHLPVRDLGMYCIFDLGAALAPDRGRGPIALAGLSLADTEEQVVDVGTLRRLSVQVLDQDHGPAAGAEVLLMPMAGWWAGRLLLPLRLDQAGRIEVLLAEGAWLVFCHRGDAMVYRLLGERDQGTEWRLAMQPLPRQQCRLRDGAGTAVKAGAVTRGAGMDERAPVANTSMEWCIGQLVDRTMPVAGEPRADGSIDVCYLPLEGLRWYVDLRDETGRAQGGAVLACEPAEQVILLR
jgi:hypothetical protein